MTATKPVPLAADLEHGLRRLKLASMRAVAPELLVTAKTQPDAGGAGPVAGRDRDQRPRRQQRRLRGKQAAFPTVKTVAGFDLAASSIPAQTWAYLCSPEWITAGEDVTLVGPAGTGKSHTLIALGHAAVQAGRKVRYFTAAELVENLYRGHADNSVGRLVENDLRNNLVIVDEVGFAPLDSTGSQLPFRYVAPGRATRPDRTLVGHDHQRDLPQSRKDRWPRRPRDSPKPRPGGDGPQKRAQAVGGE